MAGRRWPIALAVTALVALTACPGGPAAIEDPEQILMESVTAMSELESVTIDMAVDGTVTIAEMGGELSFDGTTMMVAVDVRELAGRLTFEVPSLLGLSGEAIFTPTQVWFRSSMTGPMWVTQPVQSAGPTPAVTDVETARAEFEEFLARDGVELEKLADVTCGEATCYNVRLTVAAEALAEADEAGDVDPAMLEAIGDELVFDLQVAKDTLYLTRAATEWASEEYGALSVVIDVGAFNEPVEASPPPSDEVTEDGGFLFP